MDELLIRPFETCDQSAARQLIIRGFGERFGCIDETRNHDLSDILQHYVLAHDVFLVAYLSDTLVGTGALISRGEQTSEITRVSTHTDYRCRGIATAIVTQLLLIARQRGDHRIILKTRLDWDDAIRLYKRLGFTEYRRTATGIGLEKIIKPDENASSPRKETGYFL